MKKRIFSIICAAVLVMSSMAVSAGYNEATFGYGGTYAFATLRFYNEFALARTDPTTSYITLSTQVRYVVNNVPSAWEYGGVFAEYSTPSNASHAESYHYIDTIGTFLTASHD